MLYYVIYHSNTGELRLTNKVLVVSSSNTLSIDCTVQIKEPVVSAVVAYINVCLVSIGLRSQDPRRHYDNSSVSRDSLNPCS